MPVTNGPGATSLGVWRYHLISFFPFSLSASSRCLREPCGIKAGNKGPRGFYGAIVQEMLQGDLKTKVNTVIEVRSNGSLIFKTVLKNIWERSYCFGSDSEFSWLNKVEHCELGLGMCCIRCM